jgi:hypothetical protein
MTFLIGSRDGRRPDRRFGVSEDIQSPSRVLVRIGGLTLGFAALCAAIVLNRRRLLAVANRPRSETASSRGPLAGDTSVALQTAFTGQPSRNTRVVISVLRAVGAVTDSVGIDFGTQIAPLLAFDHPPSFAVSELNVHRDDSAGLPAYFLRSANPSAKYVVALHGGAYVVQPTINHWSAYAELARRTRATVIVPIYPLASTSRGRAQTVIPDMADLISAQITQHGSGNVSVYGDSAGGGMALSVAQAVGESGGSDAWTHGSHLPMARRHDEQRCHPLDRRPRVEDRKYAMRRAKMGWRAVSDRSVGQPDLRRSRGLAADRCLLRKPGPARGGCASAPGAGASYSGKRIHLHPSKRRNSRLGDGWCRQVARVCRRTT